MPDDAVTPHRPAPLRVVIAGVAGSGKTTVGRMVAERLGVVFVDGDDLHPPSNVAKMASGEPLTDADREPWLRTIVTTLEGNHTIVVACSALRLDYREVLREAPGVAIVLLHLDEAEARRRVADRAGHFMGADMIESQFAALELPSDGEPNVEVVDAHHALDTVIDRVLEAIDAPIADHGSA